MLERITIAIARIELASQECELVAAAVNRDGMDKACVEAIALLRAISRDACRVMIERFGGEEDDAAA